MNRRKRIQQVRPVLTLLLLMAAIFSVGPVVEAEGKGMTVPVSYMPGDAAGWPGLELKLTVEGSGSARDGNGQIRDGLVTYTLATGEEKTFQFLPDEGCRLMGLTLNGENALDKLSPENELTVTMGEENQSLEAVFSSFQRVKTGDEGPPLLWWTLIWLSLLTILLVLAERWTYDKRKRGE